MDRPSGRSTTTPLRTELPILSAAFLETLISEVQHQRDVADALASCPLGYLFFDNNDLKRVNTVGNYECGTEVIRATGQWITRGTQRWAERYRDSGKGTVRDRLERAPQFWVIRWGGDEFIVIVAGGKGSPGEWGELMQSIEAEIKEGRSALSEHVMLLHSMRGKPRAEREELKRILLTTSVSVGAVFVDRVVARKGARKGKGFDGTLPGFLREARSVAEERMKFVKSMGKLEPGLRSWLERGRPPGLIIQALGEGLRWCYGDLLSEDLGCDGSPPFRAWIPGRGWGGSLS